MIPDFKTYISESVWTDMQKRSAGDDIRQEDDINHLDGPGLKDYIESHYKPLNAYAIVTCVMGILSVPVVRCQVNYSIQYCQGTTLVSKITISSDLLNIVDGLLEKLKNNFSIEIHETSTIIYGVTPKDGSEVTNKFFIEVIDFILDNINDSNYYTKAIKKINKKS